jgi:acetolactate synthase-1/2/3 large subunit
VNAFRKALFDANNQSVYTVAEWITAYLEVLGITHSFSVTGGASMHLNNSFGHSEIIKTYYLHHEQACSMAAESFARVSGRPAVVIVTAGPGSINALNGVYGAYTDSIPMIIISGQARLDTLARTLNISGLRQGGDQELDTVAVVEKITKFAQLVVTKEEVLDVLERAWMEATTGRPGPAWIDIPVNIQGQSVDKSEFSDSGINLVGVDPHLSIYDAEAIVNRITQSKKPLILAGSGIAIENVREQLLNFAEDLQIPIATAWQHDLIESGHPLCAGRPGTIGTRSGNFILQASDLILVLGSRLNIRQTGFNWESFAPNAHIIWVDIDEAEMKKPFLKVHEKYQSSLFNFFEICQKIKTLPSSHSDWLQWCKNIRVKYDPKYEDYQVEAGRINAYHLVPSVFEQLRDNDIVVCGDATACIVPFQTGTIRGNIKMFSNSGSASMGYDLPAAIGAAIGALGQRVICFAGDGSIMMNLQELQTISALKLNIIIFILENDGYLSIKQTQSGYFGRKFGSDYESGVTFPNFSKLASSLNLPSEELDFESWKEELIEILEKDGPLVISVPLAISQEFEPRIKSKMTSQGMYTPPLDEMYPFLPAEETRLVRLSAPHGEGIRNEIR